MQTSGLFDHDLIRRYDRAGPRYTSYPTAVQFHDQFTANDFKRVARDSNTDFIPRPLSLYFHIPFCDTVCFYCACNKVVTKDKGKSSPYLERLYLEMAMQSELFEADRPVEQLHWGGGTPTFLSHGQMRSLMNATEAHFTLGDESKREFSIEVDPRATDKDTMKVLREIHFNRVSMGVQDFDPDVQKAVNRIQGERETIALMQQARDEGFDSINVDLIYGLPKQTLASFDKTLDKVIDASPDRLSIFNYAHLPERFKPQRRINAQDLPPPEEKLEILQLSIEKLTESGYVYIGMDHFAKPDDELAIAQREGTLTRNFQGYSTHRETDMLAFGVSSIARVGDCYSQNAHSLDAYYEDLDKGELPVRRGVELSFDDRLRRHVIEEIICHFRLDFDQLRQDCRIEFSEYFASELPALKQLASDGLIDLNDRGLSVRPAGQLLVRHVCMVFDAYVRQQQESGRRFSKII
ncbi:MAG: oxygen-independent coproporphyrinogen III oxidase [Chromatiales bacterium]|nr:oxygen-independent coproporphyrinogen III oxidase [Chromatiales bacterium]